MFNTVRITVKAVVNSIDRHDVYMLTACREDRF